MEKQFSLVAIGGTFDHLHIGHKALIDKAFQVGNHVILGVTSDIFVSKKPFSKTIESYSKRRKALEQYLLIKNYINRAKLIELHDIYGPTTNKSDIDAIIVSRETYPNARLINKERRRLKLPQLQIVLVPLVKGDSQKIIRSERIRYGEIDRYGSAFVNIFKKKSKIILSEELRNKLRNPLGEVISGTEDEKHLIATKIKAKIKKLNPSITISVGDFITTSMVASDFIPDIQIIDFKTRRIKNTSVIINDQKSVIRVRNKAGTITKTLGIAIARSIHLFYTTKKTRYIVVQGEEDLAALVAILLAPLTSVVIYGQYGLGAVIVIVDEQTKAKALELL